MLADLTGRYSVINKRSVLRLLTVVAAMAALMVAVVPAIGAVYASTDGDVGSVTPPLTPGISGNPSHAVSTVTVDGPTVTSVDSAGDPCATRSFEIDLVEWPLGWPTDAWYKMTTYWCWNGVIVTTHHTYQTHGITTFGSAEGWTYNGQSSGWWCYVASGSHRNCSGNTEWAQGDFQDCVVKVGCIGNWNPFIQEWENYHGGFYHN
jgi:hypothetical protein